MKRLSPILLFLFCISCPALSQDAKTLYDEGMKLKGDGKTTEALEKFKASPLVASVVSHPALSNFNFRETDIIKEPSEITRAPLMEMAVA